MSAAPAPPLRTLADETTAASTTIADWTTRRTARESLYSSLSAADIAALRSSHPERVAEAIAAAERILRHEFDLLGSGPFVPRDPDRAAIGPYQPLDWYLDPVQQLRFPSGVPYKEWKLYEMRPGTADVKHPWELARCQHWPVLGQAYRLTGDERYAREIANELDDFVAANPIGVGVNWTCTMDVAIRAVNWAIGLELVGASAALDAAFRGRAYAALFEQGAFIRGNLENTYEVTSNHFLSNIVGLWFLAAVFDDLPAGREWRAFARESLEQEMDVQVLPDGADYESSIPYHRLVAELFLACARLGDASGTPLSASYRARTKEMVTYLAGVIRPDGLMPQVGDADDGRLHVFGGYGTTSPQDPRHLFGPAAAMHREPAWLALGGDAGEWESAWWGLSQETASLPRDAGAAQRSHLYRDAGVAIMRHGPDYLLVTNGIVGTKGFGNHKHNEQLSFEYHPGGVPLVVDPGSYVYTSDAEARNLFRGTRSHNTLMIDGVEQNELRPEWLFRMFETSNAEHVSFDDGPHHLEYTGRHHGYERLPAPVTHERTLRLRKHSGAVEIVDRLRGGGTHALAWHFHLAPGVTASIEGEDMVTLASRGRQWRLSFRAGLHASIVPAAYSPSYGVRTPCLAVDFTLAVALDGERTWEFSITS